MFHILHSLQQKHPSCLDQHGTITSSNNCKI